MTELSSTKQYCPGGSAFDAPLQNYFTAVDKIFQRPQTMKEWGHHFSPMNSSGCAPVQNALDSLAGSSAFPNIHSVPSHLHQKHSP
ncbi:hypothetical protein BaRGS_00028935 [Batillaria attramentaria]|uniref:Uncharacterized protein n=1 Tax=Batillaria attramentaria TaxID=370345 RepID=A0ABD0JXK2_9CAEN